MVELRIARSSLPGLKTQELAPWEFQLGVQLSALWEEYPRPLSTNGCQNLSVDMPILM